jgi:hypothetical protein
MRVHVLAALPLVLLAACDQEYEKLNLARKVQEFDQAPSNAVDILWVIDDSTSMREEQAAVRAAGADFIAQLETAEMDFHLGVITTDGESTNTKTGVLLGSPAYLSSACREDGNTADCTYAEDFATRVEQGTGGSDQEKGLEVALAAVSRPLAETFNAGFVRDGALLMIIVLTDENDCSDGGRLGPNATGEDCYTRYGELTPVGDIVADLRDAKKSLGGGDVVMSGIIGPEKTSQCDFAVAGRRYDEAIRMLGGVVADICLADYSPIMQSLGLAATGITSTFQLEYAAKYYEDDPETETDESADNPIVTVTSADGTEVVVPDDPVAGWTYLSDYAQIQFNGEAVPERGAHITVEYISTGPVPNPPASTSGS